MGERIRLQVQASKVSLDRPGHNSRMGDGGCWRHKVVDCMDEECVRPRWKKFRLQLDADKLKVLSDLCEEQGMQDMAEFVRLLLGDKGCRAHKVRDALKKIQEVNE